MLPAMNLGCSGAELDVHLAELSCCCGPGQGKQVLRGCGRDVAGSRPSCLSAEELSASWGVAVTRSRVA